MKNTAALGVVVSLLGAAFFAVSGPVAMSLYGIGWSPGAVVAARVGGAALVLLPFAAHALRGRWHLVVAHWRRVVVYGVVSIACAQAFFFSAVEYVQTSVVMLIGTTAPVMIVGWVWARSRFRPSSVTFVGIALAMLGLVFVLDPGAGSLSPIGVVLAFGAAVCIAWYSLDTADERIGVPAPAFLGLGVGVGGIVVAALNLLQVLPAQAPLGDVELLGASASWFLPVLLLVGCTVGSCVLSMLGLRLMGATMGSFVNLSQVPFAVAAGWLLLSESIGPAQLVGAAFALAGVVFVNWGEHRRARRVERLLREVSAMEVVAPATSPIRVVSRFDAPPTHPATAPMPIMRASANGPSVRRARRRARRP